VGEVRVTGLMAGVTLVKDHLSRTPFSPGDRAGYRVGLAMRRHGVFARPLGDVMVLMPPLTSSADELRHVVSAFSAALRETLP
jgi:adenosylmethionine-8-amino-7-oxononanoate aminotransferase